MHSWNLQSVISWSLADHTWPRILLHCMSQCLLCLELSFFNVVWGWSLSSLSCCQYYTFFNSTFIKIRVGSVLLHLWHLQSYYYIIPLLKLPHDVQNKLVWSFYHQTSYISEHKEWQAKVKYHPDKLKVCHTITSLITSPIILLRDST